MERSLFDGRGRRKYMVAAERTAFLQAALSMGGSTSTLCAVLVFTGARVSEVLALTPERIDEANGTINFKTLKRRKKANTREIPVPKDLFHRLNEVHDFRLAQRGEAGANLPLWSFGRITAWRRVAEVACLADIPPFLRNPRALRHSFGVELRIKGVPLELIQELLGHVRIETAMIYTKVIGPQQRAFVRRTWPKNLELLGSSAA